MVPMRPQKILPANLHRNWCTWWNLFRHAPVRLTFDKLHGVAWDPATSTLKARTLEIFTRYKELRPNEYAVLARFFPTRAAWSYLKRLHRNGDLARGRDWKGRILYRMRSRGAKWLLWWKRNFPDQWAEVQKQL